MSDTWTNQPNQSNPMGQGGSLNDLVSTQKGGVQTLAYAAKALGNAFPPATASTSPVFTGNNSITTTATTVIDANTQRHGIIFHNPGTTTIFIYPTNMASPPTSVSLGGALSILGGSTVIFSPSSFPNVNGGWSAVSTTGSSLPFTVAEFY